MRPAERLRLLLGRPRHLLAAAVVGQWLSTLLIGLRADSVDLGLRELGNVLVAGPVALLLAFRVAEHIGGVALGAWTLLVWVAIPLLAPAFALASYDETLRNEVLPLAVGLTADVGYVAGVALLAAVSVLARRTGAQFLVGGVLLAGVVVFLLLGADSAGSHSLEALQSNMAGLREYFWSQRLLQWLPLAGVIAVARRSVPLALLLGVWLAAFVALGATRAGAGSEDGELFRVLLPALPAYVLLAAALPLLVPTLATRLGPLARPVEAP